MPDKPKLLLATNNAGKLCEYRSLLQDIPFQMVSLAEEGITAEVAEIGKSFEENATLKATTLAALSGLLSLADDSGLEVDALGGEPGAMSHRFAGENATDADRINYLLERLKDAPDQIRAAQFRCVIAIAEPHGRVELCSGICRGIILKEPRGSNGFGYDPVFFIPELNKTMAELTLEEKNLISHRARAAEQARAKLMEW
jgi:XTP/dITP diphosphohydrolase